MVSLALRLVKLLPKSIPSPTPGGFQLEKGSSADVEAGKAIAASRIKLSVRNEGFMLNFSVRTLKTKLK